MSSWFVVQLGARENYAIAQALHSQGALEALVTDNWHPFPPLISKVLGQNYARKIAGRFCSALSESEVKAFNSSSLRFESAGRIQRNSGWDLILRRNEWFQNQAVAWLENRITPEHTIFAYSYAAKKILELAKRVGCKTVLGQIDPGIGEENIVAAEVDRFPELDTGFERAPKQYWDDWRTECELATVIMVNSEWSRDALVKDGVPSDKIQIVPLVYDPGKSGATSEFVRTYPAEFSNERPLELLYLGQVIPRKGIQYVAAAAEKLADAPVRFTVVGDPGPWRAKLEKFKNINVVGGVPRSEVGNYYQNADAFLFPTLSDGFGLTQLEARHWKLPLICSRFCGSVVEHDSNGIVLDAVSGTTIVNAIRRLLQNPSLLERYSKSDTKLFSFDDLANALVAFSARIN